MANKALITGASTGIGLALARIHARHGGDLALVARSQNKLEQVAADIRKEYGVEVQVVVADLTKPGAAAAVYQQVSDIDVLINNAGFGGHGEFIEQDLSTSMQMIQLNIAALTELSHLCLTDMVAKKRGKVLNVSSIASFLPGPLQAVYYATKAFVTSFSQATAQEVAEYGVTVTALCPGPVATDFMTTANLENVLGLKDAKSPESVAEFGYNAMLKGQLVAINQPAFRFLINWVLPLLPRKAVLAISRKSMEKV
ncbi:SDR family NAD(P)-dependent oxidoreductase [Salinibius halmophilus]|uniref:SDR family NAD(P)-dependent oxidoreductase n=1 Tax=Salinibius halmophilus TaxID=1853216 RepID=UPI000E661AA1|nr:SDR family oxidoreductase [Salinibius halmophilus]